MPSFWLAQLSNINVGDYFFNILAFLRKRRNESLLYTDVSVNRVIS